VCGFKLHGLQRGLNSLDGCKSGILNCFSAGGAAENGFDPKEDMLFLPKLFATNSKCLGLFVGGALMRCKPTKTEDLPKEARGVGLGGPVPVTSPSVYIALKLVAAAEK
jgi:hypothetical protein